MGNSIRMLLPQVLKALGGFLLKSGAGATQQNAGNKESHGSIESELQEVFFSEENVSCLEFTIEEAI